MIAQAVIETLTTMLRHHLPLFVVILLIVCPAIAPADDQTPTVEGVLQRLAGGEPTRIVCFGDSITGAYYHTGGERAWCDMLGLALQSVYPQARLEMVNAGISGNTTAAGLARMEKGVLARKPHLVVVMFGMNDVARLPSDEFIANLTTIIRRCHETDSAVVLCTPNTVYENPGRPISKLAELSERIRQLAKDRRLPVADCFADETALQAKDLTSWMLSMSDEIHPNMNGHRKMAEVIAEAIVGQPVSLGTVPPPANALRHTLEKLEAGQPLHIVAMPPYDRWVTDALRKQFPKAEIRVTPWPTDSKSLAELRSWGQQIRELKPDLVVPAVPVSASAESDAKFIDHYEWVLNWSFPFAGREWDVVPVLPAANDKLTQAQRRNVVLAREIILGKDVRFLESLQGDLRTSEELLSAWIAQQRQTQPSSWPDLPAANGAVMIPAQEWPRRGGPRLVKVLVHYPGGKLENVMGQTGIMLSLHNWGGEDCVGTADPQTLADRLNVVAVCVDYLQSGKQDGIQGPEPYDCGYLQALDALRAVWFVRNGLATKKVSFADGRIFATGGSGGGNVSLMANKLAPRTFACVVDLCGMKKLSADIAFHLPSGSLDARWSRDPASQNYLSPDEQDIRFVGHLQHLATMKRLGASCRTLVVHGVDDVTCPFADAQEMVANMQTAGISVEPHFIAKKDLDGKVFTSSGHALGNRTEIVLRVAEKYLAPNGPDALTRSGKSDFECRDEQVNYRTPGGQFIISYAAGFPVARFEPDPLAPAYDDHHDLSYYLDPFGQRRKVETAADWQIRRRHILAAMQRVMGQLPGGSFRVPLDLRVLDEKTVGKLVRKKISFQSDPFDRVTAWLLVPAGEEGKKLPAVLCLHQTVQAGKDEPVGLAGSPQMRYAMELAERGYVTLSPDYPSLGEHAYDFGQHPEFASGSMKGVWDNIRAVDLLSSLPEVDHERIGVIGHSLGGHNAVFTASFESRLKVVVSSCGFTTFLKDDMPSWTGPRYMPRIKTEFSSDAKQMPFDFSEVIAALAPRPFLASAATRDDDFDVSGVRDACQAAERAYQLLGKRDHLQSYYPDSPHDFPDDARKRAYEFLDRYLKP